MDAAQQIDATRQLIIFDLIFIPLATWFVIVPLSLSDVFGPNTYHITIILWSIPCVSLIFSVPFEISRALMGEIGRVWKTKIHDYLESVRETLLEENRRLPKKDDLSGLETGAALSRLTTTNEEDDGPIGSKEARERIIREKPFRPPQRPPLGRAIDCTLRV